MSDVDLIREAAALMRERAAAATSGAWVPNVLGSEGYDVRSMETMPGRLGRARVARCGYLDWDADKANAEHIASWHPAVALAVADWLSDIATRHEPDPEPLDLMLHYDSDEECVECEQGNGHSSIVCKGCYPSWDGMEAHMVWPCAEARAAITVARTYLGVTP